MSETINVVGEDIFVKSNKTLDGRGADITISSSEGNASHLFRLHDENNFIVHNLRFWELGTKYVDIPNNANTAYGHMLWAKNANKIWIDHVTFGRIWDDVASFYDTDNVTISYCRSVDQYKNILFYRSNVSMHHNHFDGSTVVSWKYLEDYGLDIDYSGLMSRTPLARRGKTHMYNNYYNQWNYGVDFRDGAVGLIENNYFGVHGNNRPAMFIDAGEVCQRNNFLLDEDANISLTDGAFDCSNPLVLPYTADIASVDEAMKQDIEMKAGQMVSPQW